MLRQVCIAIQCLPGDSACCSGRTCKRGSDHSEPLHMAVRVTAMASGTSKTAIAAFRMPGYRCRVYFAMLSLSPAGSGKCWASNS